MRRLRNMNLAGLAEAALTASACGAAFSLPAGRGFLAVALVLCAADRIRRRLWLWMPGSAWWALAWVALAVTVTLAGVNPDLGVPKLRKLVWFVGIPLTATLMDRPQKVRRLTAAYALGAAVLAVRVLVQHPLRATLALRAGAFDSWSLALIHQGSMTNGQRLMLGTIASLGMWSFWGRERRLRVLRCVLPALTIAALIVNLKRGSWICLLLAGVLYVVLAKNWKYIVGMFLLAIAVGTLPPVRVRLLELRDEWDLEQGGRMAMWLKVTPELAARYPWGIGYRSLTNRMMREVSRGIERHRDHLHSNIAQILVATGWLGLGLYGMWMGAGMADAIGAWRRARGDPERQPQIALALLLMLIALLANGLVEYNFGDAELVLAYGYILGAAAASRRVSFRAPSAASCNTPAGEWRCFG